MKTKLLREVFYYVIFILLIPCFICFTSCASSKETVPDEVVPLEEDAGIAGEGQEPVSGGVPEAGENPEDSIQEAGAALPEEIPAVENPVEESPVEEEGVLPSSGTEEPAGEVSGPLDSLPVVESPDVRDEPEMIVIPSGEGSEPEMETETETETESDPETATTTAAVEPEAAEPETVEPVSPGLQDETEENTATQPQKDAAGTGEQSEDSLPDGEQEETPADGEEEAAVEEKLPPEPSRSVSLNRGQTLEVWYPGRGWVFLGARENPNGISFDSRRMDDRDTVFLFRTFNEGSYILDFSRFDVLTGGYVEDALAVTVLPETGGKDVNNVVHAPDYSGLPMEAVFPGDRDEENTPEEEESLPSAEDSSGKESAGEIISPGDMKESLPAESSETLDKPGEDFITPERGDVSVPETAVPAETPEETGSSTVFQEPSVITLVSPGEEDRNRENSADSTETSITENVDGAGSNGNPGEEIAGLAGTENFPAPGLADIKDMLDAGDAAGALDALDKFFASSSVDADEALYLQGQAYEMEGPRRNIRRALTAYETLTSMYPYSRWWQAADRRIRYIRRFYFDIR